MTDDSKLLLTDHELLALLAMNAGNAATATRDLFRLSNVEHRDVLERAGITTLLARGMAEAHGDDIVPVNQGALVAAILTTATEWLEIALVTPAAEHVMFVAASEEGTLLFSLSRLGAHEVRPIDPSQSMVNLGVMLAQTYLMGATDGLPASAMVTNHPATGGAQTANLKRDESDGWALLSGHGEATVPQEVTASNAFERLRDVLSP